MGSTADGAMTGTGGRAWAGDLRARARGCLLAGAVGDALGGPVEGKPVVEVRARHGRVEHFLPSAHVPGRSGAWTDDTQLTVLLGELLAEREGVLDPDALASRLADWLPAGRGVGQATAPALERLRRGVPWTRSGSPSAGNGAAMRVAPIGLVHLDDVPAVRHDAALQARITHADPTAIAAAVTAAGLVGWLAAGGEPEPDAVVRRVDELLGGIDDPAVPQRTPRHAGEPARLRDQLAKVPALLHLDTAEAMTELGNGAFVLETLPAALWCFLRFGGQPRHALLEAVNAGGDCDTVAAILGNLLGAHHGPGWLDRAWLDGLEGSERLVILADALARIAATRRAAAR